jgi:mono/diheme cytochrome c family protein
VFPVGTRFWKEFWFSGHRIETRLIERMADGRWLFATYEWSADGREAPLAPVRGRRGSFDLGGGRSHVIPGVADCGVCHGSGPSPILGFSALQLSPDRDPGAPHADPPRAPGVDLNFLVDAGLLVGLPAELLATPPRIDAATSDARAALGYLHGNCGHCHNADGPLRSLGLELRHLTDAATEPGLATTVARPSRKLAPGQSADALLRVAPGDPERSGLLQRMGSRIAALQMPPLGTELADPQAIELVRRWIAGTGDVHAAREELE